MQWQLTGFWWRPAAAVSTSGPYSSNGVEEERKSGSVDTAELLLLLCSQLQQ